MYRQNAKKGSVILIVVFAIALMATLVAGILQIHTEEIQLMQNSVYSAEARAISEAGLNDAFARIMGDRQWNTGFSDKSFAGGFYSVTVAGAFPNRQIASTGVSAKGFVCRVNADVTISAGDPTIIRVDRMGINE